MEQAFLMGSRLTAAAGEQEGLSLSNERANNIIGVRDWCRYERPATLRPVRDDALERGSLLREFRGHNRHCARRAGATLSDLLATNLRFRLPSRLFGERRAGSNSGFFSHGA